MRIQKSITENTLPSHPGLQASLASAKAAGVWHLIGLVSDGGVHSHMGHLEYLVGVAKNVCRFCIPVSFFGYSPVNQIDNIFTRILDRFVFFHIFS